TPTAPPAPKRWRAPTPPWPRWDSPTEPKSRPESCPAVKRNASRSPAHSPPNDPSSSPTNQPANSTHQHRPPSWTPWSARTPTAPSSSSPTTPKSPHAATSSSNYATASSTNEPAPELSSDVEAEGPHLLAAVVGDLLGAPRRHPHPVDAEAVDEAVEALGRLVLDDVGQRARRRGQGHVDHGIVLWLDVQPVDEPEVDDVDPELGVDDVAQGLFDVGRRRRRGGCRAHGVSFVACAVACASASR